MNVCIAESSDALDFTSSDSRWFQSQHGLKNVVELCYARHGRGCKEVDRYSLLQPNSAVPLVGEQITTAVRLRALPATQVMPLVFAIEETNEKRVSEFGSECRGVMSGGVRL